MMDENLADQAQKAQQSQPRAGRVRRLLIAGAACGAIALGPMLIAPAASAAPVPASATIATSWPVLAEGQVSADVLSLQYLLNAAGHPVDTIGTFGPMTRAAVTAFQIERGLTADAVVGEATWNQLLVGLQPGSTGPAVSALQVQLNVLGAELPVIGVFGPATAADIQTFQSAVGLVPDAVVGPQTWSALIRSGAGAVPAGAPAGETVATLNAEQNANLATIVAEGRNAGVPEYGLVIAVATAMTESRLRALPDGDRDSVGVFQQRPSMGWGAPDDLISPSYAARAFYGAANSPSVNPGLLDIPNWQAMPVSQAAQAVQVSAHPDAFGYWEAFAREAVASVS